MKNLHQLDTAAVLEQLATDSSAGLTGAEAMLRLERFVSNDLHSVEPLSPWSILGEQAKNVLIIILLAVVCLSGFLGHAVEAIAIAVIVLFAVLLGFVQEYRAERAIDALRKMTTLVAAVVHDHHEQSIPAHGLAPGDIIPLCAGDKIPADARLIVGLGETRSVRSGRRGKWPVTPFAYWRSPAKTKRRRRMLKVRWCYSAWSP